MTPEQRAKYCNELTDRAATVQELLDEIGRLLAERDEREAQYVRTWDAGKANSLAYNVCELKRVDAVLALAKLRAALTQYQGYACPECGAFKHQPGCSIPEAMKAAT